MTVTPLFLVPDADNPGRAKPPCSTACHQFVR